MTQGSSLLSVFAGWVLWVYLLTLVALYPPKAGPPPDGLSVAFAEHEKPFVCEPDSGQNALENVLVKLSDVAPKDLAVPVRVQSVAKDANHLPAEPGKHFQADPDAVFVVKRGETVGRLRVRDGLCDLTIESLAVPQEVSFKLELQETDDVVREGDSRADRLVVLPARSHQLPPDPETAIPTAFKEQFVRIKEPNLVSYPLVITADEPTPQDADIYLQVLRGIGEFSVPVTSLTTVLPAGSSELQIQLQDYIDDADLKKLGLADDRIPGPDEFYELRLDPRRPLIAKSDPCFLAIRVLDDDEPVTLGHRLEDESGREIRRLEPGVAYWIVPFLSGSLETDCYVTPRSNGEPIRDKETGQPLRGIIPAGKIEGARFGPFLPPTDIVRERIGVAGKPIRSRCPDCKDQAGGCGSCKEKGLCHSCHGREGGCGECKAGCCSHCGGRLGGCPACGFGSGKCVGCGGAGKGCGVCGGGAGGGGAGGGGAGGGGAGGGGAGGGGAGGGGAGGGGAGGGLINSPEEEYPPGPAQAGDVMLLLVNNQRLHEPADEIAASVRAAIRGEAILLKAAIEVNDKDNAKEIAVMGPNDPPPSSDQAFRPFNRKKEGLKGQVQRIVETIQFHRKQAEDSGLRTVIVWPERELASASAADLGPLKRLADAGGGPISLLCPDADPTKARRLAEAVGGGVTVRSPKSCELGFHIKDVLHGMKDAAGE